MANNPNLPLYTSGAALFTSIAAFGYTNYKFRSLVSELEKNNQRLSATIIEVDKIKEESISIQQLNNIKNDVTKTYNLLATIITKQSNTIKQLKTVVDNVEDYMVSLSSQVDFLTKANSINTEAIKELQMNAIRQKWPIEKDLRKFNLHEPYHNLDSSYHPPPYNHSHYTSNHYTEYIPSPHSQPNVASRMNQQSPYDQYRSDKTSSDYYRQYGRGRQSEYFDRPPLSQSRVPDNFSSPGELPPFHRQYSGLPQSPRTPQRGILKKNQSSDEMSSNNRRVHFNLPTNGDVRDRELRSNQVGDRNFMNDQFPEEREVWADRSFDRRLKQSEINDIHNNYDLPIDRQRGPAARDLYDREVSYQARQYSPHLNVVNVGERHSRWDDDFSNDINHRDIQLDESNEMGRRNSSDSTNLKSENGTSTSNNRSDIDFIPDIGPCSDKNDKSNQSISDDISDRILSRLRQ